MFSAGQKEMKEMDDYTINRLGLPGVVLMENAGVRVVEEIMRTTAKMISSKSHTNIVVLVGGGNNGGDGFVIGRRLVDAGFPSHVWLLADKDRLKGDAKTHYDVYMNRGLPVYSLHDHSLDDLQQQLTQADIIVDAILGTGVRGAVREPIAEIISMVNQFSGEKPIIAVDIPSGVNSDTGKVENIAIQASKTVTFVCPKNGFFLQDGPRYVGEWKVCDISVPTTIGNQLNTKLPEIITEQKVNASLPKRPPHGHKGTFGHALVIGGSRHFVGAPMYTAKAAFHTGAGLVTIAIPDSIYPMIAAQNPELLLLPLPDEAGHLIPEAVDTLIPQLPKTGTIAIGPGMSQFSSGQMWLEALFSKLDTQTLVIDADAISFTRHRLQDIQDYKGDIILTPHPGEMARLMDTTVAEVEANRLDVAKTFAQKYGIYVLLKGHRPIIATPSGTLYINPHGHDALGKGGSGDILTGLITAFLAQGVSPLDAMISASYLHARSAEEKAKKLSHFGVTPMDVIDGVKVLLNRITS
ncbi:NAD(P)H-hydrate dehydratase [Oceanobacillus halotolerans]|uniref:NAD(P)H-hydrate dehydratase n=1 Tax=Oceanobacillus halotolerans TaxID=2663380 RepID=UPI0013D8F91C|nr:NAD(P)H-hydrate dehydratase [Oceanobacillus halotolerans]